MEPCGSDENQVFTKTNPWVAAILALAAEIYSLGNLKLNLKFDVEMLFRLFTLSISSYKPSDTLSCHVRDPISNPDFYPPDKPGPGGKAAPATPERPPAQAPAEAVGTPAGPAAPATPPPATAFEPPAGMLVLSRRCSCVSSSTAVLALPAIDHLTDMQPYVWFSVTCYCS